MPSPFELEKVRRGTQSNQMSNEASLKQTSNFKSGKDLFISRYVGYLQEHHG